MTVTGDNIVSFKRRFGHTIATTVRDLAGFPRMSRALGIVPLMAPSKAPLVLIQDLGDRKPRA